MIKRISFFLISMAMIGFVEMSYAAESIAQTPRQCRDVAYAALHACDRACEELISNGRECVRGCMRTFKTSKAECLKLEQSSSLQTQ